ncbi:MAG: DUF2277 domain-containing protein [Candidatus Korobacteraceae bacterium]
MRRNIKTLFNFEPRVTQEEVQAAALQFVRKISGFNKPSKPNEAAFHAAVDEIAGISTRLLRSLRNHCCAQEPRRGSGKGKGPCRTKIWILISRSLPIVPAAVTWGFDRTPCVFFPSATFPSPQVYKH